MNLDDISLMKQIDTQDMLGHIQELPDQLQLAWELGQSLLLPDWRNIQSIVIAGMGGSAIGADLLSVAVADSCAIPIFVHRDYDLPAFAKGSGTLVICSSHSGNTEEALSSYKTAVKNGCRVLAISTGGKLYEKAKEVGYPNWKFLHKGQPRTAVGFSFGLLLSTLSKLKLTPDLSADISEAVNIMKSQQTALGIDSPISKNPAKRLAGQLIGRWVTVVGAGAMAPVSRRWKGQINEIAKAVANFEFIPEADHNSLAGLLHPSEVVHPHVITLFLRAPSDHPRNRLRLDMTRKAYMLEGLNVDSYKSKGDSVIAHIWSALHFGDYVSYYLAMAYGVDPTPVVALDSLKSALNDVD